MGQLGAQGRTLTEIGIESWQTTRTRCPWRPVLAGLQDPCKSPRTGSRRYLCFRQHPKTLGDKPISPVLVHIKMCFILKRKPHAGRADEMHKFVDARTFDAGGSANGTRVKRAGRHTGWDAEGSTCSHSYSKKVLKAFDAA